MEKEKVQPKTSKVATTKQTSATKPVKETVTKPVKTAKPKVKKVKPEKTKSVKQPKIKNALKVNKPKKVKKGKRKSFLTKLIVILVSVILVLSMLTSVGYVFTLNDFTMTTILSNDVEKTDESLNDLFVRTFNNRYMDIKVNLTLGNGETTNYSRDFNIKAIKDNNNTYWFSMKIKNNQVVDSDESSYNYYYKNGKFYAYYGSIFQTQLTAANAQQVLEGFGPFNMFSPVLPSTANSTININSLEELKTNLHVQTNPFYFGEKFELVYNETDAMVNMFPNYQIYIMDYKGNLKYQKQVYEFNDNWYKLEVNYYNINQPFEIQFPQDLI